MAVCAKVRQIFTKKGILFTGVALLLVPALLTNLGLVALYDDEGIRALVALEMQASGNLATPTMFGEFYYNKPPLYNWILLAVFELTGRNDEFFVRLPTVVFLLLFVFTVWRQSSAGSRPDERTLHLTGELKTEDCGLAPALALLTCGRILFWDSMLGLIDICFSWVMYGLFMVIYHEGERGRPGRLFALSYGLAAIGFMLKGLPALVFLGIALPTYFFWQKKGRSLLSWQHLLGSLAFVLPVGGYYFAYAKHNGLAVVFRTLFHESAKRTAVEHPVGETLLHLVTFPFEMWAHFLPWTLLAVYFFRKNALRLIRQNQFVAWNLLVLAATILPYWASVQIYPRYVLMHVPLAFTVLFYLHSQNKAEGSQLSQMLENVFFALCLLAAGGSFFLFFWEAAAGVPGHVAKTILLASAFAGLSWLYRRLVPHRMLVFVLVLLVARMGFNWFVLPTRLAVECSTEVRRTTLEAVEKLDGTPVEVYRYSIGAEPVTGYYFTRETGQVVQKEMGDTQPGKAYIFNSGAYDKYGYEIISNLTIKGEDCGEVLLVKKD